MTPQAHQRFTSAFRSVALAALFFTGSAAWAAPIATAIIPTQPGSQFIGETFKTQACFDNTGAETGFQPVLRIVVPNNLTIASAAFPTGAAANVTPELIGTGPGSFTDPITNTTIILAANERLYILRYPLGSVTGAQPQQCMDLSVSIPLAAAIGTAVNLLVTPIFSLGADALDNPASDPPIVGAVVPITVTPTVWRATKNLLPPEKETATGPSWPRTFTFTADIANGATITSVVFDDVLPAQMQFVSLASVGAPCTASALTTATPTTPGGRLNISCGSVTGAASATDVVVTVTYYVPKCSTGTTTDAGNCAGTKVVDPVSGAAVTVSNTLNATAAYLGTPLAAITSTDTFTAESHTVRKSVAIVTDTGPSGLSSGDTLEYTVIGEVSDYFQFQNIIVRDSIGDGQTLIIGSSTLTYDNNTLAGAAQSSAAAAPTAANLTEGPKNATTGITPLTLRLSDENVTRGGDGIFRGARSFGATPIGQAARYTLKYRTRVDRSYTATQVGGTQLISAGDSVVNNVATDANVSTAGVAGVLVTDTSATTLTVVGGQLAKSIAAVNGAATIAGARVKPGDTITYRLLQTIPVASYEDLKIDDFLPLPTLLASEITTTSVTPPLTCTNPAAGTWCLGAATTITTANGYPASCLIGPPTIGFTASVAANSMLFDFPTCEPIIIPATPGVVEVLFTVTVRNDPIADDLNLTNLSNAQLKNSGTVTTSTTAIVQIKIDEPKLDIKKSVTASSNASSTGAAATCGAASALINADAGDVISYCARVTNTGHGPAYSVVLKDDAAAGVFTACTLTSIKDGAGTTLTSTGNLFAAGGLSITTSPALPGNTNVTIDPVDYFDVIYSCPIPITATPRAGNALPNQIAIVNYSNSTTSTAATGAPQNFATNQTVGGPNVSKASIALRNVQSVVKTKLSTNLADTSDAPINSINSGEGIDFCIATTLSEGTYTNFAVTDTSNGSAATIALPALSSCTLVASTAPTCAALSTSNTCVVGSNVSISGSTVTVAATAGNTPGIILIRTPITAFTSTGNTPVAVTNTATVKADNITTTTATTNFNVDRPNPTITKSIAPTPADAGDTVTVTLNWSNADTLSPQYRCVITDNLNATGSNPVSPASPFDVASIVAATTPAGYTFAVTAGVVTYTKIDTTTQCDTATTATFKVNLRSDVPTGTSYINTAKIDANSLPSNHPNAAGGAIESALTTATVVVTAPSVQGKAIIATSVVDTLEPTNPPLAVGEIVTYRIGFSFAEGVTNSVTLIDDVGTGLAGFEYVANSATLTRSNANLTCATAASCTFAGNVATFEPTITGNQLRFPLGAVTNTVGNGAATFTIDLKLRVTNIAGNVGGTAIRNAGRLSYADAIGTVTTVSTADVLAHVATPIIVIEKTANPAAPTGGDVVTYVITIRNTATGSNAAPAYDYVFSDTLPTALTAQGTPTINVGATAAVAAASFTGQVINGTINKLNPGESITVTYTALLSTTTAFGQIINNDAKAAASSLPGTLSGTQTGIATGTGTERTGSGGVDSLASSVKTPITTQLLTLSKTIINGKAAYAIGDLVTYRLTVNAPSGSTQNVKLVDSLPAGLSFNAFTPGSVTSPAGFSATNNPPTVSAAPAASCGGTAQTVSFDFGTNFATPTAGAVSFDFTAVVCNLLSNQSGQTLANNASATYANPAGGTITASIANPPPTITVGEPNLTVNKAITAGATGGTAGSTVGFSIVINNTGTTTAQQISLNEVLPNNKLGNITAVTLATAGAGAFVNGTATAASAANAVLSTTNTANDTLAFSPTLAIPPSGSITLSFNAEILNGILPNESVSNTARTTYFSQATTTPQTRDASGGAAVDDDVNTVLNNYGEQGSATFVAGSNIGIQKRVTPNTAVVGELVTYTVRVDVEQGTVPNVCVSDTLPSNVLFDSVAVTKGNFGLSFGNASYLTNLGAGQTVRLCFGDVVNAANGSASDDFFELAIVAKVRNVVANQDGVVFNNGEGTGAGQVTPTVFLTWGPGAGTQVNFDADPATAGFQGVPVTVKEPKLKVTKAANPISTSLGDVVTYSVTVAHDAGSSATAFDLALSDVLPAGVDYVAGSASLPAIDVDATGAPTLKFTISSLTQAEGSKTFTYQGRINPTATVGASLTNTINLTWKSLSGGTGAANDARTGADGATGALNDYASSGSAAVTVNAKAFLDAVKTVAITTDNGVAGQLDAGDVVEWTIVVKNTDPSITATNVIFTDTVPVNTTYVAGSLSSTQGSVNSAANPMSVAIGAMAPGGVVTIKFKTSINAGTPAGTIISNQGSVDSDQTVPEPTDADDNDANGDQPTTIVVGPAAPLSQPLYATKQVALLTDTAPIGQIGAGDTMRYTVIIFNRGNAPLTGVAFSDVLPAGLTYVSNSASSGGAVYTNATRALAWTGIATIAAGAQQKLTFDVTIDAFAGATASFVNQATVRSNETPSTLTDQNGDPTDGNQPTPFTAVGATPPTTTTLDAQKRVKLVTDLNGNGLVNEGDTIEYAIRVTNTGAIDATNVRLTDPLPGNATLDTTATPAVSTSVGSVTSLVSPIAVNIGTLTPGQTAVIVFRMKTNVGSAATVVSNQAAVSSANAPSTNSDDNSTPGDGLNPTTIPVVGADPTVAQPSGMVKALVATSEADSTGNNVLLGEVLTYEVTLNLPTGTTRDVTMIDTLPANLGYVAGSGKIKRIFNTGLQSVANPGGVNTAATNTLVPLTDGTHLTATILGSGDTLLAVRLGDIINSDNDPDAESYVLQIKAVVKNINANQGGTAFTNTATLTYLNGLNQPQSLAPVSGPTITVIEPVVTSSKSANIGTLLTTGGTVRYNLTIGNAAGGNVATAYNVSALDALPAAYTSGTVISVTPSAGVVGATASFTGTTLNVAASSVPAGGSMLVVYDATAPATVTAANLLNTAVVAWTSLPGANGTANATPGAPGSDTGERTGSGIAANDYTTSPSADVKVGDPQITKSLVTTNARYAIGDTARYSVVISVPPGSLNNANFVDTLPAGLSYVSGSLSFTPSLAALSKSNGQADFTVTGALPTNGIETLTLPLGTVSNSNAAPQSFTAVYDVRVDNIVENQNGQTRTNKADFNFNTPGGTGTTTLSNSKSVTVGEPVLALAKSISTPITNLDAGDLVTFKVVLTNSGTTTAFDALVSDTLPAGLGGLSALAQTLTNTSGVSVAPTLANTATSFTATGFTLAVGDSLEITFNSTLQTGVQPGQAIQNTANVAYSSRPGTDPNERTGADGAGGTLNDYATSGAAPIITVRDPLAIDKTFFPNAAKVSYAVGETVSYRVKVSVPEGTTNNVVITDTLPTGLSFLSATVSAGNVSMTLGSTTVTGPTAGVLAANVGTIINAGDADPTNDFVVLDITARVANVIANQTGVTLTNNARVSYSNAQGTTITIDYDRDASAVGAQGLPLTVAEPDVALSKTAAPTSVSLGDDVLYTLTLDHSAASTSDAYQLVVTDTLPAGLTFVVGSSSLTPTTVTGQVITWNVGALTRATDILNITYRAKVSNAVALGASLTNTAALTYTSTPVDNPDTRNGTSGPNAGLNNYAGNATQTVSTNVNVIEADKTASYNDSNGNGQLDPGEVITWTIVLTNDATAKTNVVFTDTVPANTTYVASSLTSTSPGAVDSAAPVLQVNVGPMAANAIVTISFKTTVNAGTPAGTVISNQGVVDSDQTVPEPTDSDGNDANGDQPTTLMVGAPAAQAALQASKTVARRIDADSSASTTAGDTMRYTITLKNVGTAPLTNVGFVDQIPVGLTYVAASITPSSLAGGSITQSAAVITLTGATLAAGATASFSFDVTINPFSPATLDFTNQGSATSDQTQPTRTDGNGNPADGNQPTVFTAINPAAPPATVPILDVQKRVAISVDANGNGVVNPADRVIYTITVKNTSTVTATNVRVSDMLPTGEMTYIGPVTVSQGVVITSGPSTVLANLATLAPNAAATVSYVMDARTDSAGKVASNQASVTTAETGATPFVSDNNGDPTDGRNPTLVPIENPAAPGAGSPTGLTKTIIATSEASSVDPSVLIGEVVTYRINVNLPAGVTRNANIADILPVGMAYVAGSATLARSFNTGLTASGNPGAINSATSGSAVALTDGLHVLLGAQSVTVPLGDVTNSDNDADAESYTLLYKAVVQNSTGNNAGVNLVNSATLNYTNALSQPASLTPATTSVRVTEAQLITQKAANPGTLLPSGGNVTYTVTVTNPVGADRATAFDVQLRDTLPTPRVTAVSAVSCTPSAGVTVSATLASLPTVGCDVSSFAVGGSLTLTYTASYSATAPSALNVGDSLPNTAATTWTSLPGSNGSASATPGAAGSLNGERGGSNAGSNDLTSSATANVNVGIITLDKSIVNPKSAYAIGDEVDYRVLISIPGNLNQINVLDTLDAGLLYKAVSLTVTPQAGLSVTPVTPSDFTVSGQNLSLALGNANVGSPVAVKTVTLTYKAIVRNIVGNWTGASLGNAARATYINPGNPTATQTTPTDRTVITVGEPFIALGKTIVSAPTPVDAGSVITYDVTVANNGTTAGFDTVVKDTFPATLANAAVVAVTPNFANGSPTTPTITPTATGWSSNAFTLNAGDSVTIRFTAVVQTGVQPGQTIINAASATFSSQPGVNPNERTGSDNVPQSDRTTPNNYNAAATAPAVTAINPVTLSKAIYPDAARTRYAIGETVSYRLRVTLFEGTVNSVVIRDALPAGLSVLSAALSTGNTGVTTSTAFAALAAGTTGTLTFNLGTVTNPGNGSTTDDFLNIDITAKVDNVIANQDGAALANTASLDYNTATGAAPTVTTPPVSITVKEPVVQLLKSANPTAVSLGDEVVFTLTLDHTSASSADAYNLVVTDTLPAGLSYSAGSASVPPTSVSGQVITWNISALTLAQDQTTITYRARVALTAAIGAPLTNSATLKYSSVAAATGGRDGSNGIGGLNDYVSGATAPVTPSDIRSIAASKTVALAIDADASGGLTPGDTLEYTIVLNNRATTTQTNVVFTDLIPTNTTYVAASLTSTKGSTADASSPLSVAVGSMAPAETVTVKFRVRVNVGTAPTTVIRNQGSVDSDQIVPTRTDDPALPGAEDPTDIVVGGLPPVSNTPAMTVTKSVALTGDTVAPIGSTNVGDTVTFTLIVQNSGNVALTNVTLTDPVATAFTVTGTSSNASRVGNTVTALLGNLAVGAQASVSIAAVANAAGNFTNQASVTSAQLTTPTLSDGDSTQPGAQPTPIVVLPANVAGTPLLGVVKAVAISSDNNLDGKLNPGETITYTLTVRNTGTAAADNVVLTDTLPAGLVLVDVTPSQGALVSGAATNIVVNIGSIGAGGTARVTVTASIPASTAVGTTFINTASITATGVPATPSNPAVIAVEAPTAIAAPTGSKQGIDRGYPIIEWRQVWINSGSATLLRMRVVDPVDPTQTFIAGSLVCTPTGSTVVISCVYDAATKRVIVDAAVGGDLGKTTEATASNEVVVVFRVTATPGVTNFTNVSGVVWDRNGNGDINDDVLFGLVAVTASASVASAPVDIPTTDRWVLLLLSLLLLGAALRRAPARLK